MKMKFFGTFDDLRVWIADHRIVGCWQCEPNGVRMLRLIDGANLQWASSTKSLWCDGRPEPAARLQARIEALLSGTQGTS